jgi:hypothetical protein
MVRSDKIAARKIPAAVLSYFTLVSPSCSDDYKQDEQD